MLWLNDRLVRVRWLTVPIAAYLLITIVLPFANAGSIRRELRTVLSTPVDKSYFLRYNQQFDGTTRRTINSSGLRSVLLGLKF